jgi:hypothetical protein
MDLEMLADLARSLNEQPPVELPPSRPVPDGGGAGGRPGDDFNRRASWEDILPGKGWVAVRRTGEITHWRRPDKKQPGTSATTGKCRSPVGGDLLYVFSSNAQPFEPERCYSKFSAFALLYHGGDFALAAADLARRGYGEQGAPGAKIPLTRNGATGASAPPPPPEAWDEPAPFPTLPALAFPLHVFPSPLREMVEEVAAALPCPPDMPACIMLAALATAIGNTREVRIKSSWAERARLWLAVVARPGSKKSPAAGLMLAPVRSRQHELRQEHLSALLRHEQAVEEWGARPEAERGPKPRPPVERQAYTVDATREALADLLAENPRGLLIHRDELAGWVRGLNQYKQGGKGDDKQFWLSLWSGEDVVVNRRGRRVFVEKPFTSVSGNLPPGVLPELNDERGREDGFIHRILFSWPAPVAPGWTESEPPIPLLCRYKEFVAGLYALAPGPDGEARPLGFTLDGKTAFIAFVESLAADLAGDELPDQLRGPWSKLEGYCARFALILHCCRQVAGVTVSEDIDGTSAAHAVELAGYFQAHARRVYPHLLSPEAQRLRQDCEAVLGWIARNRDKIAPDLGPEKPADRFSWRMVRRDLHHRFEGRDADLHKALETLEGRGYLREEPREARGGFGRHPKPNYAVSPLAYGAIGVAGVKSTPGARTDGSFGTEGTNVTMS